jgi:hypothetical protein
LGFEKINKIDKTLTRLRKKRGLRNEKEGIATNNPEIKKS